MKTMTLRPGRGWVHNQAGFTLLELLVVMVIMTLVLAVTPPLISGAVSSAELQGSARELVAGLRFARSQAIAHNREVAFELDVERRRYRLVGMSPAQSLPDALELELHAAQSEFSDAHTGAIRFFPDGSSTGGRITVSLDTRAYSIEVGWITGQVAIHE